MTKINKKNEIEELLIEYGKLQIIICDIIA